MKRDCQYSFRPAYFRLQSSRSQSFQRGGALIIVLLAVAMMSIVAFSISERTQYGIKLLQNTQMIQQARWYALGAEQLLVNRIGDAFQQDGDPQTTQLLSSHNDFFEIEKGYIRNRLTDLRTCFNINALAENVVERGGQGYAAGPVKQLQLLLQYSGLTAGEIQQLSEQLYDWLDPDTIPVGISGAEDLYYTARKPSYRTANGAMADISELYLLDVAPALINKVKPLLCVLPYGKGSQINVNTVQRPEMLSVAMQGKVNLQEASSMIQARGENGYNSLNELIEIFPQERRGELIEATSGITLWSDLFRADIEVQYRDAYIHLVSFIKVADNKVSVYQRHYGGRG